MDASPNISKQNSKKILQKSSKSSIIPRESVKTNDNSVNISKMSVTKLTILETISKKEFVLYSLVPMYICVILSVAYPQIIGKPYDTFYLFYFF